MGIHDELRAELRDAMRSKDQRRLAALRQVESEAAVLKTAPGFSDPLDDAFYRRVIAKIEIHDVSSAFAMEQIKYTTELPLDYLVLDKDGGSAAA